MIFDSHAHYEDKKFDADRVELLTMMKDKGIGAIVNVGSNIPTSEASIRLAGEYDGVYAAVGIHPIEVATPMGDEACDDEATYDPSDVKSQTIDSLRELSQEPRCVAIGEIGLDYHYDKDEDNHILQRDYFISQLELAGAVDKPVIIHSRDAAADTYDILSQNHKRLGTRAVIHCYSGSAEMASDYIRLGYYIGVGGVVTFKNGRRLQETVESIALEHILLETDCPYMAPEPHRGERNDSTMLPLIVEKIAEIKGIATEEVERVTWDNACRFYGIG